MFILLILKIEFAKLLWFINKNVAIYILRPLFLTLGQSQLFTCKLLRNVAGESPVDFLNTR